MHRKNELIEFIRILYRKKKRGNLGDMEARMRSSSVDLIETLEAVISEHEKVTIFEEDRHKC